MYGITQVCIGIKLEQIPTEISILNAHGTLSICGHTNVIVSELLKRDNEHHSIKTHLWKKTLCAKNA